MTQKKIPELGPLEYQLFRILAKRSPCTAREVLDDYNLEADRELKYTTVMTLLTRMAEKGVLSVDRARMPFHFSPRVSREQLLRQRVQEFVELFFEGRSVDLAVRLVEDTPLSRDAVKRLEESLERLKSEGREKPAKGSKTT